jgi:predicted Zn-dependent protease
MLRQPRSLALAALLLALLSQGCTVNPATGERELILMSPEREATIGRREAHQVAKQIGLLGDPALVDYVRAIGERIARVSPRTDVQYEFHVADMPEANAFALPGGYIYLSRGLLALANSEDELANVIGHEIAHVAIRHAAQRETRAVGVGLLNTLGVLAAGALSGGEAARVVGQMGQLAGAGLIASYSRTQEREADRLGQELAARAGWDPTAMAAFLRTLERYSQLEQAGSRPSFFDSHPATPERATSAWAHARLLSWRSIDRIAHGRAGYLARIEGLLLGPDPAGGIFRESRFLHADLDLSLRFPAGWAAQNTRSAVSAISPERDALIQLEPEGAGDDPGEAAAAFAAAHRVHFERAGRVRIGALRAYRALAYPVTEGGAMALDLTWIAYRGLLFRISCATTQRRLQSYGPLFQRTAHSFRQLDANERNSIMQVRLRVVKARPGETLAELSSRTDNAWSLEETAVMNAFPEIDRLQAAQPAKIAVAQVYRAGGGSQAPGN